MGRTAVTTAVLLASASPVSAQVTFTDITADAGVSIFDLIEHLHAWFAASIGACP